MKLKTIILFLTVLFTMSLHAQDGHFVKAEEIGAPNQRAFLIDVRTPEEFKEGSIPSAVNIDVENEFFPIRIEALNKNNPIILFCKAGNRSKEAYKILTDKGFTNVKEIKGGYDAWLKAQAKDDSKEDKKETKESKPASNVKKTK